MRGKAKAAHGFLDAPLVVEVRDACPLVRRSHGCVDVVCDAGLARQGRKTLALRLFPLDSRLPRVLHAEDAPRAGQRTAQRRLVIEIAPLTMSTPWRASAAARSLSGLRVRPRRGN